MEKKGDVHVEQIVKGYRADDALRRSFDALAQRTFGLTFEDWYQNGFWATTTCPIRSLWTAKSRRTSR